MKPLSHEELVTQLAEMPNWELLDEAIEQNFEFHDFNEALSFLVSVGLLAEKADHHPEIWNVYNRVRLRLNTHSENTITSKDIALAKQIDALLGD
jgi:4a-hydroxytetrahydrobiopterin dehydratase